MKKFHLFFLTIVLILFAQKSIAAPKSDLWQFWQQDNPNNHQKIDHDAWQQILDTYLITRGQNTLFRYSSVKKEDKKKLKQYITRLTQLNPKTFNKDVQFAYWVNLYNALTVNLILDNYPLTSITKLGGFFSFGPWDKKITKIAGQELSLNDIEHRILRPIWKDARIHYVVNCASLGCPNLSPIAFTSENNERLLNKAATNFVNSAKGVSLTSNVLTLSSIYDWYASDFGANEQQILNSIDKYRTGIKLKGWSGDIKYQYDWQLNQAK